MPTQMFASWIRPTRLIVGLWRARWEVNVGDVVIFYRKIKGPIFAASFGRLLLVSRRAGFRKIWGII